MEINKRVYLVGITGIIGSGKTTVSNILRELNYYVFDVDIFSRKVLEENTQVIDILEKILGIRISNNKKLDYKKIGKIFDENPKLEVKFELWYQSFLGERVVEEILNLNKKDQILFFDIPLLEKKGISHIFDHLWIIRAKENQYYSRVKNRNNYSNAKIKKLIEDSQIPQKLLSLNTKIIENNSSIEELKKTIDFECRCIEKTLKNDTSKSTKIVDPVNKFV